MNFLKNKNRVKDYSGSSEHLKKKTDVEKLINYRLKILMGIIMILVGILVWRLYQVQIVQAEHFADLREKYTTPPIKGNVMRGEFHDRNGKVLVSNKTINTIVYDPIKSMDYDAKMELGMHFANAFPVEEKLNEYDLKTLWLRENKLGKELLTDEENELFKKGSLKESEAEKLKRERITEEMINSLSSEKRKAFNIVSKMENIQMGQSALIMEEVTNEQIAYLAEHANEFPGFSHRIRYEREHNEEINLETIFGGVGDIPYEKLDYFISSGYAKDAEVGVYGLEYQYERLLSGVDVEYEKNGSKIEVSEKKPGQKGFDLVTAIDFDLQKYVESESEALLKSMEGIADRKNMDQIQVVVSDPNTGDILAFSAVTRGSDGNYFNDPQRIMLNAFPLGSTVKGATVYMGLNEGVMKHGQAIMDTPMTIAGTPARVSYRNLGMVDDVSSLKLSSNIYMFYVAIGLGNTTYVPNGPLVFPDPIKTYGTMRDYYSQFGLGVKTQVDYPREEIGFKGSTNNSGTLLEFAIGQFDNYNALQLNQYISTIANGGYRMKPRFVTEAQNHDTKETVYQNNVEVLNVLENPEALSHVREGMRQCAATGNCTDINRLGFPVAAKTGTAQDSNGLRNSTFVAFAPFDSPKVAVSCVAPNAYPDRGTGYALLNVCGPLTTKVIDYYMKDN